MMDFTGLIPATTIAPTIVTAPSRSMSSAVTGNLSARIIEVSTTHKNIALPASTLFQETTTQPEQSAMLSAQAKEEEADCAYSLYIEKQFPLLSATASNKLVKILDSPNLTTMTVAAQAAVAAMPPRTQAETRAMYIRRIKAGFPSLSDKDAAAVSGMRISHVRRMSEFIPVSDTVKFIRIRAPRYKSEAKIAYVRRLKMEFPALSAKDAAAVSGAYTSTIQQIPEFKTAPAVDPQFIKSLPARRGDETCFAYALRLKGQFPALTACDAALITGATLSELISIF